MLIAILNKFLNLTKSKENVFFQRTKTSNAIYKVTFKIQLVFGNTFIEKEH
jgi:hypothetical protein